MHPPNPTYVVPQLLADQLARAGVRHACLAPGSRSAPLAIALAAHGAFRVWTHVDERSAGFFALGLAKATRAPVAIACTSGSAAANLLPAVVEAHHARVPLVVLTADRPPELRECGAPQTIDQHRLFGVHTRWFVEVDLPGETAAGARAARRIAARAAALAAGPPAGPVHLNVPLREPLAPESRPTAPPDTTGVLRVHPPRLIADHDAVADVAEMLRPARRPLIVCGPLDDPDPMLPAAVAALAGRLDAPVVAEPASNLRRPALDDVLVDAHDALARATTFADRHAPDVVLRLGALPTSKPLVAWLARLPGVPQVLLDGAGAWSDPDHVATALLTGTPASIVAALADRVASQPPQRWRDDWRAAGMAARAALREAIAQPDGWCEGAVVAALADALPPAATLYAGNSLSIRALDWFWPAGAPPLRVLANRGANGIDGFVSSLLGAAAGAGGPAVGLCGDLSFLHDAGGLLAAHRHRVRAVLVVLDNDGGGIFDHLPIAHHRAWFEELFVTPHGLDLEPLVRAWGAGYARAGTPADLVAAVRTALDAPRTTVVHVPIDRARSLAAHRRAWRSAVAAVEAAA